jgi:hypothetical protein
VSRGLGILQRRVCEVLYAAAGHQLPLRELRCQLGEPDRSNLRRAIRGLLRRGLVEVPRSGGGRRVGLTSSGLLWMRPPPVRDLQRPPIHIVRPSLREHLRALVEAREEEERRRQEAEVAASASPAVDSSREGHEQNSGRRRPPGPTQKRVLYVLWKYADPVDEGLPVSTVKAIVGGDRSNTRRAIRTLLLSGELEESEDGERVRLSRSAVSRFSSLSPPTLEDPLDEERAAKILRAHRRDGSTRQGLRPQRRRGR